MELIRRFPSDLIASALADWNWLDLGGRVPMFTSWFGDMFLSGENGIWFLDTLEGTLTHQWRDALSLQAALNTVEGQDKFLMWGLAQAVLAKGQSPSDLQVLSFKIMPAIGGSFDLDNIEVSDLVVSLSIMGQVHRQLKDLAPGTKITGFSVDGHTP
jgi:hypothetical protein